MKKITQPKLSEWQLLVRQVRAIHPDWILKQQLQKAKEKYKKLKQKGGASGLPKKPIGIAPIMRIPKQPKNALE